MSLVTVDSLIECGVNPTQARAFADPLAAACALFDITSPLRLSAFISQCVHESAGFTRLEENLYYSSPERVRSVFPSRVPNLTIASTLCRNPKALANRVYSNRYGNGGPETGDGWAYRGRGIIGLTFKNNYADASVELGRDYVSQPDLVAQPSDASLTAAWFWHVHKLNLVADKRDVRSITRVINPGMAGLEDREHLYPIALRAFT